MNWEKFLQEEQQKEYYKCLVLKLDTETKNHTIYPSSSNIFNAFHFTPFDEVKTIIIGQDPYHGAGQAMGLSFSVPNNQKIPPSLRNIFKEIESDLETKCISSGDLSRWAIQGVFLLNASLTVREHEPNSHQSIGWQNLTANAIGELNRDDTPKVFLLWGAFAKKFKFIISNPNHLILEAAHPSPLSAYRGFFGCKHFSQTNAFLRENGREEIDWR